MRIGKKFLFCFLIFSSILFSQGFVCVVGGGGEGVNDWNREPYSWIVQKADSGTVIVLSVNDETTWIPDYFRSLGASTSYNLRINSRTLANTQYIADSILAASAIFIKGGDQWNYINYWKGTLVEDAIKQVFNRGGVVAGTSAGAMVLGKYILSARYGSLYPDAALVNPFIQTSNIESNFLGLIPDVIFDTHFIERGRQARLATTMLNLGLQGNQNVTGVGLDDRTALCISPDKKAVVMGSGSVSFYRCDSLTRLWSSGTTYELENLYARQLTKNWVYDLNSNQIAFIPISAKSFNQSAIQFGKSDITLTGSNWIASSWVPALSSFITRANTAKVLIISYPAYSTKANSILNEVLPYAPEAEVISYTLDSENDSIFRLKVDNASAFIFAGDDLTPLKNLTLQSSSIGNLLRQKITISATPTFYFGELIKLASTSFADNLNSDPYAAYRGKMVLNGGLGVLPGFTNQALTFASSDYYENRLASVFWSIFKSQIPFGLYGNSNGTIKYIAVDSSLVFNRFPLFFIDASSATLRDSSIYRASSSTGPRQVVALDSYRISASNNYGRGFSLSQKRFITADPTGIKGSDSEGDNNKSIEGRIRIKSYPNPFNSATTMVFSADKQSEVKIDLFDITGKFVKNLFAGVVSEGEKSISLSGDNLPSGVYFIRLVSDQSSMTHKLILNK